MTAPRNNRFAIVFEHLDQAANEFGFGPVSAPETPESGWLSPDELDQIREFRDLVDDLSEPVPILFTTD